MHVPVGHGTRIQLHPIDLAHLHLGAGPIRAEDLRHEAAAGDHIAQLDHPDALDARGNSPCPTGFHGLRILRAWRAHGILHN
jgi:hypothetical protein